MSILISTLEEFEVTELFRTMWVMHVESLMFIARAGAVMEVLAALPLLTPLPATTEHCLV